MLMNKANFFRSLEGAIIPFRMIASINEVVETTSFDNTTKLYYFTIYTNAGVPWSSEVFLDKMTADVEYNKVLDAMVGHPLDD